MNERVEDTYEVNWFIEMVLKFDEVLDSVSWILQNTVEVGQAILDQHIHCLHVLDNIKESTNNHLGCFLILLKLKLDILL